MMRMLATAEAAILANPAAAQVAANAPPASNDTSLQVDDIIATAQKREQSLQDVPISIIAFNADATAALSAETIGDLDTFTPGLTINDTSVTQPSYAIRGVQTDDFGIGTKPSVGSFIDRVFSGRAGSSLIFFNDVARVGVLKGPHGTLFGRSTSAGAISIITRKPNATPEMKAIVQLGNCANQPITENLFCASMALPTAARAIGLAATASRSQQLRLRRTALGADKPDGHPTRLRS